MPTVPPRRHIARTHRETVSRIGEGEGEGETRLAWIFRDRVERYTGLGLPGRAAFRTDNPR